MPRTFLVRRVENLECETDNIKLISCEPGIPSAADVVVDSAIGLSSIEKSDVNQIRMLNCDRNRTPLQPSTLTERSESKFFVNLDTGDIEQQTSPLDMLANAALERSVPLAARYATSIDTNAMSEKANCGPLSENSRKNVTELSKSPRKQRAIGKENSPRKSAKKNQSLPSFASLAYTMVLANQNSKPNSQNDLSCTTSNGAKHTMPPVPVRNAFPLARRKLPINSPSFKVWNELKPSSVIHPSSPFLRSCQPDVLKTSHQDIKAKKELLPVTNPKLDVTNPELEVGGIKEHSVAESSVKSEACDVNLCSTQRGAEKASFVPNNKSASEGERNIEIYTVVPANIAKNPHKDVNVKTDVTEGQPPLVCPSIRSDLKNVEASELKTVPVHIEHKKTVNSAKPKIWNPLFHEPTPPPVIRSPIETPSLTKPDMETCETIPNVQRASWHQPSTVYNCSVSTQNDSIVEALSLKEGKSTHAHSLSTVTSSNKSSLHKFSIDSILSRVEKRHDHSAKTDYNKQTSDSSQSETKNTDKNMMEPEIVQASKRMRLYESQSFPRQSVIVATSSVTPSLPRTSTPVLKPTDMKTQSIDEKENISAAATPVFLWNIPTKAASKETGHVVYSHPTLVAMANANNSPITKNARILLPNVPHASPVRSLKPTIGEIRNWNIPVPTQQMPSPVIVKKEPEVQNPVQISPVVEMAPQASAVEVAPQVSPAVQMAPRVSSSLQMAPQVSPAIQMALQVSPAMQIAPRVSSSLQMAPQVSPAVQMAPRVSSSLQMAPQVSPAIQMAPQVCPAMQIAPRVSSSLQMAPPVSPALQMAPRVLLAPPNTPMTFQRQQAKPGVVKVFDENNPGKLPIALSSEVELVNGGFGLKNPSFRPPKPSDITNVSKDPTSGNGKYACSVCKKEFALQRLLNRHLKCHSDTKRFLCTFCGKGFNDTFDLKRHTRIHTGVKPYKCSKCERSFTQRCSLESHCRKVHNVEFSYAYKQRRSKIYVCEECGHSTDDPEVHFIHLRDNHPNNPALTKCHDKRQFKFNENNRQTLSLPRT